MVYLDTRFVAPLVIAEDASDAAEAFVLKVKPGELTTSLWTQVELSSLVSRKVRVGELSDSQAQGYAGSLIASWVNHLKFSRRRPRTSQQRPSIWSVPRPG